MSFGNSNSKAINRNNGAIATLEGFESKKEGFQSAHFWNEHGYDKTNLSEEDSYKANKKAYADAVIKNQINPLLKQSSNWDSTHGRLDTNFSSITSDYDKMVVLRDQLNEVPPSEPRTIEIGPHADGNIKLYDVANVDASYQRISVEEIVDSTNEASGGSDFPQGGIFKVKIDGKTLQVEKTAPLPGQEPAGSVVEYTDGWDENLKINISIETIPDKKYFHHADDWELGEKRKNQREQHMWDTKELLLYTNQFYIIGSITTALALIFAYKRFG